GAQGITRVVTFGDRRQDQAFRGCGRQVLERVDGEVDPSGHEFVTQRVDEHTGATELGQVGSADVTEAGDQFQFDLLAGALRDGVGEPLGLSGRHGAATGTEFGGRAGHAFYCAATAAALVWSDAVDASAGFGSRSNSSRRAAS